MITASKAALAFACPAAFALPQTAEKHAGQDEGNETHAELEQSINDGAIPDVLVERWPDFIWRSEVAFALDLATGEARELGAGIGRAYGDPGPFVICGTADIVGRGPCDELVIVDRKSYSPHVPRAAINAQLHTLALAAARAYKMDAAEVAIWHEVRPLDVAKLDTFDLDGFAVDLRGILAKVADARRMVREGLDLHLSPGQHCRYCEAFHSCPAQRQLQTEVKSGAIEPRIEMMLPLGNDEVARDAYELRARLRILLKRLDSALFARANERPIPLGNGRMFGPHERKGRESLSGDITYEVLRTLHGQHVADAAVERHATKAKLKEALSFVAPKGGLAALERKALEAIRARGGATAEAKVVVEEYTEQVLLEEKAS